jgi:hypothetical protein
MNNQLIKPRRIWIGKWFFHSLWSKSGAWTVTRENEEYRLWLFFGPVHRKEGRAFILTIWKWQLIFTHLSLVK